MYCDCKSATVKGGTVKKSAGKAWERETILEKRVEGRTAGQVLKQDEAAGRVDTSGWFITQQPLSS